MVPILENFYWMLVIHHSASGFTSRIPLLLFMYLVATGNQKPGRRLLSGVLAAHFAISWYISVGVGGQIMPLALVSFALLASCAWLTWSEETPWKILPESGGLKVLAILGYVLAFTWPFWRFLSWWAGPFFSPMAVLPHQTLAVLLILLAVTGRGAPILLLVVAGVSSLVIAAIDLLYAGIWTSLLLPLLGLTAVGCHFLGEMPAAEKPREEGKSSKPTQKEADESEAPKEEQKQGGRKWDVR